jgi:hypothetical protein
MPITFNCTCGKTLRVPDEHAGRRAKCPACNAVLPIPVPAPPPAPEPEPVFEVVEDVFESVGPNPNYKKPIVEDEEYDGTTYGFATEEKDPVTGKAPTQKRLPNFRKGGEQYS